MRTERCELSFPAALHFPSPCCIIQTLLILQKGFFDMKRFSLFLLSLVMLAALSGCGSSSSVSSPAQASPPAASAPAEASSAPEEAAQLLPPSTVPTMPEDQQKQLLMEHYDDWAYQDPWSSPWSYTFTDLDHNGRLEVTAASLQGSGFYTYAHIWEVNADFSGITECLPAVEEEGMSYPDIIVDSVPCYFDASSGHYYYLVNDFVRGGYAEHYESVNTLCLHDGIIDIQTLAAMREFYSDPDNEHPETTYYDSDGNESSEEVYRTAEDVFAAGKEKTTLSLEWTQVEIPWPEEEAISGGDEVGPAVVITKSPRDETITAGGKTWFIAHADNAVSLTWLAVNPDGFSVSLQDAMAQHPGLSLEALEEDTLAVSNVPLSFDGWGIAARFDGIGDGNFEITDTAWITVTNK